MTAIEKSWKKARYGMALCLFLFLAPPAFAQDTSARLNRLENEIQTLSRAVFRGEMPPAGTSLGGGGMDAAAQANIEVRLSQIEMEVRTLTGRIEQMDYENRQYRDRLEQNIAALEMRLADMEMRLGGTAAAPPQETTPQGFDTRLQTMAVTSPQSEASSASPEQPALQMDNPDAPAPADAPSAGTLGTLSSSPSKNGPTGDYEAAFGMLRDQKYDEAEKAFTSFLQAYPDSDLAANAKYWLGETFYVRNNFERAARIFAEAYQQYPKGPKGPDNLLKLALSLNGLGKKQDACLTLVQLRKEYASGAGAILARAEREASNLGCTP